MPYVTSVERIGRQEGARDSILEAIDERFKMIPKDIVESVKAIEKNEILKSLLRHAISCENLDVFRGFLKKSV
ncbi:hypothetical protein QUF76_08410 [Desulfobacterales bacterium HSG16]|nr:hypothetical protein [Desulfobacterales bacterium HSG16]